MQDWTATMRHAVTRKINTIRLKHTRNLFRKNLQLKHVHLDIKSFRSWVKGKHSIGRELQSLPPQGKKLLPKASLQHLRMVTEKSCNLSVKQVDLPLE